MKKEEAVAALRAAQMRRLRKGLPKRHKSKPSASAVPSPNADVPISPSTSTVPDSAAPIPPTAPSSPNPTDQGELDNSSPTPISQGEPASAQKEHAPSEGEHVAPEEPSVLRDQESEPAMVSDPLSPISFPTPPAEFNSEDPLSTNDYVVDDVHITYNPASPIPPPPKSPTPPPRSPTPPLKSPSPPHSQASPSFTNPANSTMPSFPDPTDEASIPTGDAQPTLSNEQFAALSRDFFSAWFTAANAQGIPFPSPPASNIASSSSSPAASRAFAPIPTALDNQAQQALRLLTRISNQLSAIQCQQQDGFNELRHLHDTYTVNAASLAEEVESHLVAHTRVMMNEVNRCFAKGGPREIQWQHKKRWEDTLFQEISAAEDKARKATKGERHMRALNIRLLQENNDLRRQLNQPEYMDVPIERVPFEEGQAEFETYQRLKKKAEKAAAKEEQRHAAEQSRIHEVRTVLISSDDEE